jgi:peptidoglycan/LPS O-acetylase OafA/YrhL
VQKQSPRSGDAKSKTGHVAALDGVRGIAVLSVFIFHYGGGAESQNWLIHAVGKTIKLGWSGVTLFFVLSGFLITGILWKSRGTPHWWRTFFLRRCLRIFPLYYLVLLFTLIASIFCHTTRELGPSLAVYVFYLQNFPIHTRVNELTPLWLGHFWSLAVEEHFYLVWPFLLFKCPTIQRARQLCLLVFVLSMASRAWILYSGNLDWHFATPARVGELAIGAWLALAVREHPEWVSRLRRLALPVFFGCLAVVAIIVAITGDVDATSMPMYEFGLPMFSFAAAALIVLALEHGTWSRWLSFPPLRHLGVISYGVYVYHVLFREFYAAVATRLAPHLSRNAHLVLVFFVSACLTILIAEASYHWFERPLLQLKDRIAPTVSPARTIPAAIRM